MATKQQKIVGVSNNNHRKIGKKSVKISTDHSRAHSRGASSEQAAGRIQRLWRSLCTMRKGLAALEINLATNRQELLSFDELPNIPHVYRWSYYDESSHYWLFDIRSLYSLKQKTPNSFKNPYTQLPIHSIALKSLNSRLSWLKIHHYSLLHDKGPIDPQAQWTMNVAEAFVTMDALGYNTSADWFLQLDSHGHYEFRRILSHIWSQLSKQQHKAILGRNKNLEIFDGQAPTTMLIRPGGRNQSPTSTLTAQKENLHAIKTLITSAKERTDRGTGALYVLTALVHVCNEAAEAYPWLTDVFHNQPRFEFYL